MQMGAELVLLERKDETRRIIEVCASRFGSLIFGGRSFQSTPETDCCWLYVVSDGSKEL